MSKGQTDSQSCLDHKTLYGSKDHWLTFEIYFFRVLSLNNSYLGEAEFDCPFGYNLTGRIFIIFLLLSSRNCFCLCLFLSALYLSLDISLSDCLCLCLYLQELLKARVRFTFLSYLLFSSLFLFFSSVLPFFSLFLSLYSFLTFFLLLSLSSFLTFFLLLSYFFFLRSDEYMVPGHWRMVWYRTWLYR